MRLNPHYIATNDGCLVGVILIIMFMISIFWYIFHLTWSEHNSDGFPEYQKFMSIEEVKEFIEQSFTGE